MTAADRLPGSSRQILERRFRLTSYYRARGHESSLIVKRVVKDWMKGGRRAVHVPRPSLRRTEI